jgi:hypothetical protein
MCHPEVKMPRHTPGTRCAKIAVGLWLVAAAALQGQEAKGSLAGTWKFNAEKTREAAARRPSDTPVFSRDDGLRSSAANNRSRSAGAGSSASAGGGRADLGPLGLYARPLPELVITQSDSGFTISDPRGTPRTYRSDGRKEIEPLLGADSLQITARWKDGKLTTERRLGSFGVIKEVYSLDPDSHVLLVDVKLSAPQLVPPLELHWIYDLAPGS